MWEGRSRVGREWACLSLSLTGNVSMISVLPTSEISDLRTMDMDSAVTVCKELLKMSACTCAICSGLTDITVEPSVDLCSVLLAPFPFHSQPMIQQFSITYNSLTSKSNVSHRLHLR